MKRENIVELWPDISDKLRNRFTKLTESDVNYVKGFEEDLYTRLETRLGKSRFDVLALIDTL